MKFTIENVETKRKYEFTEEEFYKRLASFLALYETHKALKEKENVLARLKLAFYHKSIFMYESNGFKFMILPERREP